MSSSKFKYLFLSFVTSLSVANATQQSNFSLITGNGIETSIPQAFIASCSNINLPDSDTSTTTKEIPIQGTNNVVRLTHTMRGSDTVIVLGQGLPDSQNRWKHKRDQLAPYDIVTFDYCWKFASLNPQQNLVNDRYKDVMTIVNYLRTEPTLSYKKIIGLGTCYSAFTFASAQAHAQESTTPLFDKLIFDSIFDSLLTNALSTTADPSLSCNNDTGFLPDWAKWIFRTLRARRLLTWIIPDVSIIPHLSKITATTPILFIHGLNDLLVPIEAFRTIWDKVHAAPSVALITPYSHVRNMKYNWPIYKTVCDCFIQADNGVEQTSLCTMFFPDHA